MKTIDNCDRMRSCELRSEKLVSCKNCILRNNCKESNAKNGVQS